MQNSHSDVLYGFQQAVFHTQNAIFFFHNIENLLLSGPILDIRGMGAFFYGIFSEKRVFCFLAPPKQMSVLTAPNENIFFKTQGTRLGAIVAPNKGPE